MLTDSQKQILTGFGHKIVQALKEELSKQKINAGGDLSASIRFEVTDSSLTVYALDYLFYADVGRKPGKRPPKDAIKEWIEEKHIFTKDPDSLAFAIQKSIAKKGNIAHQRGGKKVVENVVTDELITEIQNAFAEDAIKKITSDIFEIYELSQAA